MNIHIISTGSLLCDASCVELYHRGAIELENEDEIVIKLKVQIKLERLWKQSWPISRYFIG